MNSQGKTFFIRTALLTVYGFIGAGIFTAFEKRGESYTTISERMLDQLKINFTKHHNITDEEFDLFARTAYEAIRVGLSPDWTFFRAVDFSYTALTTIGYGHLTPITTSGKLFCIVFCLFGIPLCLLTLKTAGELISRGSTNLILYLERKVLNRTRVTHVEIKCAALTCIGMVTYLSFASAFQVFLENWTFTDAFYAWFIAFSTVGFGDYIPFDKTVQRDDEHGFTAGVFHVLGTFPAVFGICIVASVINSLLKVFEKYEHRCARENSCCATKRTHKEREEKETKLLDFGDTSTEHKIPQLVRSHSV